MDFTEEKTYTLKEVAEMLHVANITIYKWVSEKKLNGIKIGRSWVFTATDINNFVNKQKKK